MKRKPNKVSDAVKRLTKLLTVQFKTNIKNCDEEDLINYHFTLGQMVRNEFGLWQGNIKLLKDCLKVQRVKYHGEYKYCKDFYKKSQAKIKIIHPDDASMVIIRELKRKLNDSRNIRANCK